MAPNLILLALCAVAFLMVAAYALGGWVERRRSPLWLEGRLLDEQHRLAKRIADLKVGETAEEAAEKRRQEKLRADIMALDQKNQTP